jgi:hypothetical protein
MQASYELYVRHEFNVALLSASRNYREQITRFIESLAGNPFQTGDYSENDSSGRLCSVKVIGKFAVYFWADHAAKEVRVVDLLDADMK